MCIRFFDLENLIFFWIIMYMLLVDMFVDVGVGVDMFNLGFVVWFDDFKFLVEFVMNVVDEEFKFMFDVVKEGI